MSWRPSSSFGAVPSAPLCTRFSYFFCWVFHESTMLWTKSASSPERTVHEVHIHKATSSTEAGRKETDAQSPLLRKDKVLVLQAPEETLDPDTLLAERNIGCFINKVKLGKSALHPRYPLSPRMRKRSTRRRTSSLSARRTTMSWTEPGYVRDTNAAVPLLAFTMTSFLRQ